MGRSNPTSRSSASTPRQRGFTLLEVLVALAVVAISLGALVAAAGAQTRNSAYLQDKTFAHWVAMNRIAELQLTREPIPDGRKSGSEKMAERTWHWSSTVSATDDPNVRRIEVVVREQRDQEPIARLTAFLFREQGGT